MTFCAFLTKPCSKESVSAMSLNELNKSNLSESGVLHFKLERPEEARTPLGPEKLNSPQAQELHQQHNRYSERDDREGGPP